MVYLEYHDNNLHNFWQIEIDDNYITFTFGSIGTAGQSETIEFETAELAQKEVSKLIAQKRKEGYKDINNVSKKNQEDIEKRINQLNEFICKLNKFKNDSSSAADNYYSIAMKESMEDIDNEVDIYNLGIKYTSLRPLIYDVFNELMKMFEQGDILWFDEETQAGLILAKEFALSKQEDISLMIRFINCCDINHEVYIMDAVIAIWNRWGFRKETSDLVVAYMLQSQHGIELPIALDEEEMKIKEIVKDPKSANIILSSIKKWIDSDALRAVYEHRSEHSLEMFMVEMLPETIGSLFSMDSVEAEESAQKFYTLYKKGKTPKIIQITNLKKEPLINGSDEIFLSTIMEAIEDLSEKTYKCLKKHDDLNMKPFDESVIKRKGLAHTCIINIKGEKYNKLEYFSIGNKINSATFEKDRYAEKTFNNINFSEVSDSYIINTLFPTVAKWLEDKIDEQAFDNLYSNFLELHIAVWDSKKARAKITIDRRNKTRHIKLNN